MPREGCEPTISLLERSRIEYVTQSRLLTSPYPETKIVIPYTMNRNPQHNTVAS
jgi:hypothetical protein